MNVGMRNANDGISMAQTAEGAMGKVGEIFQRMRELAVQATNATNSSSDKKSLDTEFGELAKEVQRVFSNTWQMKSPLPNSLHKQAQHACHPASEITMLRLVQDCGTWRSGFAWPSP